MPARPKLTEADRRAIALAVLSAEKYGSVSELVKRYGISRGRVYQIADNYKDAGKLAALEDEVRFRRQVAKLIS